MARTYHLYRHFDKDGTLLYVGVSADLLRRTVAHNTQSKWWDEVATITVERYSDHRTALEAELAAIKDENPKHNVHRNRLAPWPSEPPASAQPSSNGRGA